MFKMEEFKDKQYFEYMRKECKSYGMECRNLIHYMRCVYNSTLQDAFYNILSWKIDIMSGEDKLNEEGVTVEELQKLKRVKPWLDFNKAIDMARINSARQFAAEPERTYDDRIVSDIEKRDLGIEKGFALKIAMIQYYSDMTYKITPSMAVDYGVDTAKDLIQIHDRLKSLGIEVSIPKLVRTFIENYSLCTEDIFILFRTKSLVLDKMKNRLVRCSEMTLEQSILNNMYKSPEELFDWLCYVDSINDEFDIDRVLTKSRIINRDGYFQYREKHPSKSDEECLQWAFINSYCSIHSYRTEDTMRARCLNCNKVITSTPEYLVEHIRKCVFGDK